MLLIVILAMFMGVAALAATLRPAAISAGQTSYVYSPPYQPYVPAIKR